jgi:hypothetical protein
LWKILKEFGVPEKIVTMIRVLYEGFQCTVLHEEKYLTYFLVETGVKQGCLLSGMLFLLAIDWLMKRIIEHKVTGIEWVDGDWRSFGRCRLCGRSGFDFGECKTGAGKDDKTGTESKGGWTEGQWEEDANNENEL